MTVDLLTLRAGLAEIQAQAAALAAALEGTPVPPARDRDRLTLKQAASMAGCGLIGAGDKIEKAGR